MLGDVLHDRSGCAGRACRCRICARLPRTESAASSFVTGLPLANSSNTPVTTGSIAANTSSCVDKAHLDVELIELARQAVGARVLVAETRRDLEVAVEARHHQELLVLLRRLRQRVELAGMNARRHQEVARAFRRGRGQDRGLELEEALLLHPLAHGIDDRAAGHDVLVQLLATQVEETVLKPYVFRIFLLAEHRQRQFGGRAPAPRSR